MINENLFNCNINIVLMKAKSAIDMTKANDYEREDLHMYQRLIGKLIYFAYGIRPDIAYAVGQLSRYNADSKKAHL